MFSDVGCLERVYGVGWLGLGSFDGEAGSGEAAGAAVVGEAPLLHKPGSARTHCPESPG